MTKTLYIGVAARARHGKDTFASELHALLPRESKLYSLAAALKAHARVLGLMTTKDAPLLQSLGTDVYRRVNKNIWVDTLKWQIEEDAPKIAIITDVRFSNEVGFIKAHGGLVIRLIRLNPDGSVYYSADRDPNHSSELAVDSIMGDYEFRIYSGDGDAINDAVRVFYNDIRGLLDE